MESISDLRKSKKKFGEFQPKCSNANFQVKYSSISRQKTFSFTSLLEGAVLFVHIDTCTNEQFVRPGSCYFKDFKMGLAVFVA